MLRLSELEAAHTAVQNQLLGAAGTHGHWEGRLSSSALATAVAVVALARSASPGDAGRIHDGMRWLESTANDDGGWGDSPESPSNLSTTLLAWSALDATSTTMTRPSSTETDAGEWLRHHVGSLEPSQLVKTVLSAYGSDRTFSIPILTMATLCGRNDNQWRSIPQLPFELAALPQALFRWIRLPVVSYAIPALVALGLLRHHHAPSMFFPLRWLRNRLAPRLLESLVKMQPEGGGFLEAVPLTAFVVMSLAACGRSHHPVTTRGLGFLRRSQRPDGSWPIDTDLATWVSTKAVEALAPADSSDQHNMGSGQRATLREWLLTQQTTSDHPFTGAASGGWGWTDAPGSVPDADDTAGALIALHRLGDIDGTLRTAAADGVHWLLALQNRDGGMPTFCRGWGRLPFDRSCPDITAHALRAWVLWRDDLNDERIDRAVRRGIRFLRASQNKDGSWFPLWFGNQARPDQKNPVYGTALVLDALLLPEFKGHPGVEHMRSRGLDWLVEAQNTDGGWGSDLHGESTVEESSLALGCLAASAELDVVLRGADWLVERVENGPLTATPIGLYFASLWYSEDLYPLTFATRALRRTNRRLSMIAGARGAA